ncbi:hypothetical protein Cgig2_025521 [Carnegiea gigantea]|uniref:Reverse transcriptase domain-containing protein n=1 Tax=Carnegiea gigantea TaxID=171969 RepID=A0A9Q1K3Q3_9CARY|nr:hypothetical protein Cgig2_025521 [Carnegiea gigantea]
MRKLELIVHTTLRICLHKSLKGNHQARPFTIVEAKQALVLINKCLGNFGYNFTNAYLSFFQYEKLLKEFNATLIVSVPKIPQLKVASDLRHIACCNVAYKTITKMLCNRLKDVLPNLVDQSHSAFIAGRSIMHSVIISKDLVRMYNRKRITQRCIMKIDFRKVCDIVNWCFLRLSWLLWDFLVIFLDKVIECVTTISFTISVNGDCFRFFPSWKRTKVGKPIVTIIFILVMEYLSRTIKLAT